MAFRLTLIVMTIAWGCSAGNTTDDNVIGTVLTETSSLTTETGEAATIIHLFDDKTNRVLMVETTTLNIVQAMSVAKPDQGNTVIGVSDGTYAVNFSEKHVEVMRRTGQRETIDLNFQGTPISAAHNFNQGFVVLLDDLQSIGIMELSSAGDLQRSWLGGSLIDEGKSLLAGDIDDKKNLILATSDKSILTIDLDSTLTQLSWAFTSVETSIESINWVAPDYEHSDLSLIASDKTVAIFDSKKQSISESFSLEDNDLVMAHKSKVGRPHVIVQHSTTGQFQMLNISGVGSIESRNTPNSSGSIQKSFLSSDASEITSLTRENDAFQVGRIRLSDNLIISNKTINTTGDTNLSADLVFINRNAALGFLETHAITSDETKQNKGFNLDYYRNR